MSDCPDYTDEDFEKVLEWAKTHRNTTVVWCDEFVDGRGRVRKDDKMAFWSLIENNWFIGFDVFKKEHEEQARRAAAMFVYLTEKGIGSMLADSLSVAYVQRYERVKVV